MKFEATFRTLVHTRLIVPAECRNKAMETLHAQGWSVTAHGPAPLGGVEVDHTRSLLIAERDANSDQHQFVLVTQLSAALRVATPTDK